MQNSKITVIEAKSGLLDLNLKELWRYRDLVVMFVKRDLKSFYKQTILGPLWIVINPFLSTFVFTVIFGIVANISTEGVPQFLFFMAGNIMWGLFSRCLNNSSSTFVGNAGLFGKVYFPRLVMPLSSMIYNFVTFFLQFAAFLILVLVYLIIGSNLSLNYVALLMPLLILQTAFLGTGFGLLISSITAKYRDLKILVSFGLTLWMYLTPIVYPSSQIPQSLRWLFMLNPVAPIVEAFRYGFLGCDSFEWLYLLISLAITLLVLLFGIVVFNRVEKNFIDTV